MLSISLLLTGTISIAIAHNMYSAIVYPYMASDYGTQISLYSHHMWLSSLFVIGHGAHVAIYLVLDSGPFNTSSVLSRILIHRDIILGHLIWITLFLGLHSFGLYIHNDMLYSLGRLKDSISDTSLQLKPVIASLIGYHVYLSLDYSSLVIQSIGSKIILQELWLGTSDFLIVHISSFTIHVSILIVLKGSLYCRSSRIISDKHRLGFLYPCDGPGRGGTCQVSSWDHIFLSIFWMYNSISVMLFHNYWKLQSDNYGYVSLRSAAQGNG